MRLSALSRTMKPLSILVPLVSACAVARAYPTIQVLSPGFVIAGSGAENVVINGTGFYPGTTATLDGIPHAIHYLNSANMMLPLTADDQANFGIRVIKLTNPNGTTVSTNLPVLYVPAGMLQNSLLSTGDTARLQAVIQKGRAGLPITIAGIGGGITEGAFASSPSHSFMRLFKVCLHRMFPNSPITIINAGVGYTSSDYGSLRLYRDVLNKLPKADLVIVEYAVTDRVGGAAQYGATFEGIIRQLEAASARPAIIALMMMDYAQPFTADNDTAEPWQGPLGEYYNLPMVSYFDAISPELISGAIQLSQIDFNMHYPNDAGYAYAALFLQNLIETVAAAAPPPPTTQTMPSPMYSNAFQYTSLREGIGGEGPALNPTANSGFTAMPGFVNPPPCRAPEGYESSTPGSTLDFTVKGTDIFIGFWACYGPMGRAQVYVDGVLYPHPLDGWFPLPNEYERKVVQVATGLAATSHKVHIVLMSTSNLSSTGTTFRVLYVGAGGVPHT